MPGYISPVSVHYTKQAGSSSNSNRIAPAPMISITPEIYYANDNPIGYTYNITLNGYANALRKELDAGSVNYGMGPVLQHMGDIRDIFSFNGGDLHIKQASGDVILAKGATIKSITFNPSDNRWVNYSPFTVELEFNEIDFNGCTHSVNTSCNSSIFHQISGSKSINNQLIDIQLYKIKSLNDKWTINVDDQIYDGANSVFKVSYTISAVGKNYYVNNKVVPAWQQAKLFVQNRLRSQIMSLINGILPIDSDNACSASKDLTQIHDTDTSGGILENFNTLRNNSVAWDVYNEYISCDTSEADGSFSLTYNALVKKGFSLNPSANAVLHSYTKDFSISTSDKVEANITVKGRIQGLVRGGFIYYDFNHFQLPASGAFLTVKDGSETKYDNARSFYTSFVGNNNDLLDSFKTILGVTKSALIIKNDDGRKPIASSLTLEHNYTEGSYNYTAVYDRNTTIFQENGYTNISIVRNDPVEIIQEFVIPGRAAGPLIQKLNMKSARTISINIDGASKDNISCSTVEDLCDSLPIFNINGFDKLIMDRPDMIKTKEDYTSNKLDGSFSISLEYIVKG